MDRHRTDWKDLAFRQTDGGHSIRKAEERQSRSLAYTFCFAERGSPAAAMNTKEDDMDDQMRVWLCAMKAAHERFLIAKDEIANRRTSLAAVPERATQKAQDWAMAMRERYSNIFDL
jgi:hypothetical protein